MRYDSNSIGVLLPTKPKWCKPIMSGIKTVEIRKTRPNIDFPFKCYIYETKGKYTSHLVGSKFTHQGLGKVIGEFTCDKIDTIYKRGVDNNFDYCYLPLDNVWGNDDIEIEITAIKNSCISKEELNDYGKNSHCIYAWHISNLIIYDEPKEITDFYKPCIDKYYYCPCCKLGTVYISETEEEFYRVDGECNTEWICHNYVKRAPQSWCYIRKM